MLFFREIAHNKNLYPVIFIIGICSNSGQATEIYRTENASGQVIYSDTATQASETVVIATETYQYKHKVASVIDGDTIILENGEHIRLLGINTPEIESYHRQAEAGGQEAKKWLAERLQDKQIYLEYDVEKRDKYNRSLAHIFLVDGEHLNTSLLETGLASLSLIPPNLRYAQQMTAAQQYAEAEGLGIWSMKEYQRQSITAISKKTKGWQRFQGEPKSVKRSRKYARLIFSDKVDVRIPLTNLYLFPELESYVGKRLEVRGWASRKKAHYSILIRHPTALLVQ